MKWLEKYGFHFLLAGIISDFLTPYVLGLFYPGMNHLTMIISSFGKETSPVHQAFNRWSIFSGILVVLSMPAIYATFRLASRKLALLLAGMIGIYGIGDCMFTGLFSIETGQTSWTLETWLHNIGSGVGFAGFFLSPIVLVLLFTKTGKELRLYVILMVASFLVAFMYLMARLPGINQLPLFSVLGFWQRASLFFNYLPLAVLSIEGIRRSRKLAR